MGCLSNLRHLDILECANLTHMPRGLGRLSSLQTLPLFVVSGEEHGRSIAELKDLNQISGHLTIRDLHDVKDPMEVVEAKLNEKSKLKSLHLYWRKMDATDDKERDVLDILLHTPPPNLKKMKIDGYGGVRFPPSWMPKMDHLVKIELFNLPRCEHLPPLGQIPSLETLSINGMDVVTRIATELCGDEVTFPYLKYLKLCDMPCLEEWYVEATTVPGPEIFPCLEYLEILRCPKLKIQPCIPSSTLGLYISNSNEELLAAGGSLKRLSKLKTLHLEKCKESSSSSAWDGLQYLTALEELKIRHSEELTCLPDGILEHHLPSLRTLKIRHNPNLRSLGSEQQKEQPPLFFTSLHDLEIKASKELTALPEWIGGLTSLQYLTLRDCPKLAKLPDGIQHLTSLKQLHIGSCPLLKR